MEQNLQYLVNLVHLKQNYYICFIAQKWRNTWNLSFLVFSNEICFQKCSSWVPGGPNTELSQQCDVTLWRNMQMFWTRLLNFNVFLLNSILLWFMSKEKSSFLIHSVFFCEFSGDPFHKSNLKSNFMHSRVKLFLILVELETGRSRKVKKKPGLSILT